MRSRYSAYALGGLGQYLLETWFPASVGQLTAYELSQKGTHWIKLAVLNKSQSGDNGYVEFLASYTDGPTDVSSAKGNEHIDQKVYHERSVFKRVAGKWLYVGVDQSK